MNIKKISGAALSSWSLKLYFFNSLPSLWFWGVKLIYVNSKSAAFSVNYNWFTKNPFNSIYFAVQNGVAEFATGALILQHMKNAPPISMYVISSETKFLKIAKNKLVFTCDQGELLSKTIDHVINQGPTTIKLKATGKLPDDSIASEVYITWSFKKKSTSYT